MSKFEMRELATKMERYPDQFEIMSGPDFVGDNEEPEVVAEGVQSGTHEWSLIIEALKAASA